MARDSLARALEVGGDDRRLRAALRYCEGQLYRSTARQAYGVAKPLPEDNGESQTRSPHPAKPRSFVPTGPIRFSAWLARLCMEWTIDRGADALQEAHRHGYTATDRETAQLADGYRARGNSLCPQRPAAVWIAAGD